MRKANKNRKAQINLTMVETLSSMQCTEYEIAAVLGIEPETLSRHKQFDLKLREAIDRGREKGKASLRRAQFKAAVEDGNPTMQIWLGKQYLGQRDQIIAAPHESMEIESPKDVLLQKLAQLTKPAKQISAETIQ